MPRALGVMGVLSALLTLAVLPLACLLARRPLDGLPLRVAAYALVLANIALVGLTIFFANPRYAPTSWQRFAAVGLLVLVAVFARRTAAEQRFTLQVLARAGQVIAALPIVASPWIISHAIHDRPTLEGAPVPTSAKVRGDAPRRIILVTFDALRASSTSLGSPRPSLTPRLAELAKQATYYAGLRAASDFTTTSVPTILAGVGPRRFMPGLQSEAAIVRQGYLSGMAAHLVPAGYHSLYATMGVSPAVLGFADEFPHGYHNGWFFDPNMFNTRSFLPLVPVKDWLLERASGHMAEYQELYASMPQRVRKTFEQATAMLAQQPEHAFLWVHVGAPHAPYFDVSAEDVATGTIRKKYRWYNDAMIEAAGPAQRAELERVYERYVHFADGELGRFARGLQARGLWDDSLVVITSDHGEQHVSTGLGGHANGLVTEAITRVPLLVHYPNQAVGRRDDRLCGHVDLLPTVLGRVYEQAPEHLSGYDLLADLPQDRVLYAWGLRFRHFGRYERPATLAAYRGRFKYMLTFKGRKGVSEALYDIEHDQEGLHDVASAHPEVFKELRERVKRDVELYGS
jgi:arylsulfatase A-like enzyme